MLLIFKSSISLQSLVLSFGNEICESKARRVFGQLKPPINVFSKSLTYSDSVGRAIKHVILSL